VSLYPKDLSGLTFGKLLVMEQADDPNGSGRVYWRCICECVLSDTSRKNALRIVRGDHLTSKATRMCVDCAKEAISVGRPKGSVNKPIKPRFLVRMYVAPRDSLAGYPSCGVVKLLGNNEIIQYLEPMYRKQHKSGLVGIASVMDHLVHYWAVPTRGTTQFANWVRKAGVVYEKLVASGMDDVEAKFGELSRRRQPKLVPGGPADEPDMTEGLIAQSADEIDEDERERLEWSRHAND
jgi:hypothetical protein